MSLVAIVGRPNVGKSTLFNRLTETRSAIVSDEAGTTRDRQYGKVEWGHKIFSLVDTGGLVTGSEDVFEDAINRQVTIAIQEADVILFMVDVTEGVSPLDKDVAKVLRTVKKPVLLVANKTDNNDLQYMAAEFYQFGLGDPMCISSVTGSGTGDLLDEIVRLLPSSEDLDTYESSLPRIAIVGRPNAGKSSLVNAFMGIDRNIVTDVAGTTRDSIYTKYNKFGKEFYIVDTAGIRKKSKVNEDLEFYSVMRSIRAIENSDVCVLMIDATRGIEAQDQNIFSVIQKNRKGLVVCVNKWDMVEERSEKAIKVMTEAIKSRFSPFTDFPIVFTSAVTKQRIFKAIEESLQVFENRNRRIPTRELTEFLLPLIENYPPPATKGKYIKIKYVYQIPETVSPTFLFFANLPQYIKDPYKRFLENKIREQWNFSGTPLQLFFRDKSPEKKL
ncbi:MAG: ribosome biogenesis GTPase Der [Paludibacteraceae bacterium]|nr:ribosome biogenesis GTPase Der [Paludibacteraceae bacterium]